MKHSDFDHLDPQKSSNWEGLSEIDQAIHENRLTEYRWRKTWADPWARRLGFFVLTLFVIFAGFVIYWDVLRG